MISGIFLAQGILEGLGPSKRHSWNTSTRAFGGDLGLTVAMRRRRRLGEPPQQPGPREPWETLRVT